MFYTLSRQCSVDWFIKFTLSDTITECAVVNVQWRVIYMFIKKMCITNEILDGSLLYQAALKLS